MLYFNNCALAQLTIQPGGFITIQPSGTFYVGTTMNIESNSTGSGYFVDKTSVANSVTVTGNISVERYMLANGWHNVATPVSVANASIYSTTDLVFYYDETKILNDWNFGWVWYQGALSPFKGYDVFLDASAITVDYTATNSSGLNTGLYNIGITKTDVPDGETANHKGWNLIGNPYPSPIDWLASSGWDKSNINDAKYIWNPTNDNYTIYLGGASPIGINGGTRYIPSNQGFWVQATTTANISINNNVRTGTMTATPDYYKNNEFSYPIISLLAKGNSLSDENLIRFIEGTTRNFDRNYDATKLYSGSKELPQISLSEGNLEFAVNSYPEMTDDLEIPINFTCQTQGYYCIELGDRTNLNELNDVYIYDKFEKTIVNLTKNKQYCFQHDIFNAKQRFSIVINPSDNKILSLKNSSSFLVYSSGNEINILNLSNLSKNATVQVVNILGQEVFAKEVILESKIKIVINSGPAYYIVRVTTETEHFNTTLFIH